MHIETFDSGMLRRATFVMSLKERSLIDIESTLIFPARNWRRCHYVCGECFV